MRKSNADAQHRSLDSMTNYPVWGFWIGLGFGGVIFIFCMAYIIFKGDEKNSWD